MKSTKLIKLGTAWYTHHNGEVLYSNVLDENFTSWDKATNVSKEEFDILKKEFGDSGTKDPEENHVKEVMLEDVLNVAKFDTYHKLVTVKK